MHRQTEGGRGVKLTGLLWWIDRWRKSTAYTDMTLEEQGAYRNLIDEAYLRGGALPDDERILGRACGDASRWQNVRTTVMRHFDKKSDGWHNATLDKVYRRAFRNAERQREYRNKNKNAHNEDRNAGSNEGHNASETKTITQVGSGSGSEVRTYRSEARGSGGASLVQPRRRAAAWEGARLHVPQQLHADLIRLRNSPEAEKELLLWYEAVSEDYTNGANRETATGADMFAFWRDRFSEKWPRASVAVNARRPAWAVES